MRRDRGWLVIPWALMASCSGPTSPTCSDRFGRGPVASLLESCVAAGSDLQCQATRTESGYCAGPSIDVTAKTKWTTSDQSIGIFDLPGHMTTAGAGLVEVAAAFENLQTDPIAFTVALGGTPERMLTFAAFALDESNGSVPGVNVEFIPERGTPQTCQTSSTGTCSGWVFDTPIRVTGTKAGYSHAQATAFDPFKGSPSLYRWANLVMRPQ